MMMLPSSIFADLSWWCIGERLRGRRVHSAAGLDKQHRPVDDGGQKRCVAGWHSLQQSGHKLHCLPIPEREAPLL